MTEVGKVNKLMKTAGSPATTMQECDRKRGALLELGNIGNIAAVPVLLSNINNPIFSITVMDALEKIDFKQTETELPRVIEALETKIKDGSEYEQVCAKTVLEKLEKQKNVREFHHPKTPEGQVRARKKTIKKIHI